VAEDKPRIVITYCTQCQWLLRAGWMAQELLSTFGPDIGEVALVPGTGGIFTVECDGDLIWERKRDGGFPDAAELKRRVRDLVWPDRELGHSGKRKAEAGAVEPPHSATGVQITSSIRAAPVASMTSRSKPSAMPLASGMTARAARKSSSIG